MKSCRDYRKLTSTCSIELAILKYIIYIDVYFAYLKQTDIAR